MFGTNINSFDQIGQIVEGHIKEITKQENDLYNERIKICKQCPLYSERLGGVCDAKKCLDETKNQMVSYPGKNITCGCGCRLQAKARLISAKCVLNKW